MRKQEEIRGGMQPNLDWGLRKWLGDWFGEDNPTELYNASKSLRQFLHSQGCVLRVDRELPPCRCDDCIEKADYVAADSLVKE